MKGRSILFVQEACLDARMGQDAQRKGAQMS
jgi:hypothetical protein